MDLTIPEFINLFKSLSPSHWQHSSWFSFYDSGGPRTRIFSDSHCLEPRHSMYAIYAHIDPSNHPNVYIYIYIYIWQSHGVSGGMEVLRLQTWQTRVFSLVVDRSLLSNPPFCVACGTGRHSSGARDPGQGVFQKITIPNAPWDCHRMPISWSGLAG